MISWECVVLSLKQLNFKCFIIIMIMNYYMTTYWSFRRHFNSLGNIFIQDHFEDFKETSFLFLFYDNLELFAFLSVSVSRLQQENMCVLGLFDVNVDFLCNLIAVVNCGRDRQLFPQSLLNPERSSETHRAAASLTPPSASGEMFHRDFFLWK